MGAEYGDRLTETRAKQIAARLNDTIAGVTAEEALAIVFSTMPRPKARARRKAALLARPGTFAPVDADERFEKRARDKERCR